MSRRPSSKDFIDEDLEELEEMDDDDDDNEDIDEEDLEDDIDEDDDEMDEEDGEEGEANDEENDDGNSSLIDQEGDEEEEDGLNVWGRDKSGYYQEKEESDSDVEDEEELEAEIRERNEANALEEENFFEILEKQGAENDDDIADRDFSLIREQENLSEKLKNLPDEQKLHLIKRDCPELLGLLDEYKKSLKELRTKIEPILKAFSQKKYKENEGVSFLDVKANLLLSYCMNILFYLLLKIQGKPVRHHPVIQKLIYLKTLIGKTKPIEKKLEYQINKLLRISQVQNEERAEDPLMFKPKPTALAENITTENFDVDEKGRIVENKNEKKIYKAPKISAQLSREDKQDEKKKKQLERKKKFLIRSTIMDDMAEEFSEKPREEKIKDILDQVYDKEEEERIRFEEENFVRLPVTKKDKIKLKKKMNQAVYSRPDDFRDIEKMRDLLKEQGLIEKEESKEMQRSNLKKTLASFNTSKEKKLYDEDLSSEDEFYKSVKNQKKEKKNKIKEAKIAQKEEEFEAMENKEVDIDNEGRKINYKILKNKGLIRNRRKDEGNARLQLKKKYKKAIVKLKSKGKTHRNQKDGTYGGETTGIRAGVIKSVPLK